MNLFNKTLMLIFVFALFAFANAALAQSADKNCFEIKYFDFFGLDDKTQINWSVEEIDKMLASDFSRNERNTSFLIPPIVFQLKDFYPDCKNSPKTEQFDKLVALYFEIRQKDVSLLRNKTIAAQLDFIRNDYYSQLRDQRTLSRMRYTMDDGPLYGEISESIPKSKPLKIIAADFGKLTIIKSNNKIFLVATNKSQKRMWSRIIKGIYPARYLENLEFDENSIEKTSLATIIHFYADGEKLTLYLRPNGEFMYYFHSW